MRISRMTWMALPVCAAFAVVAGCQKADSSTKGGESVYLLKTEPAGAEEIIAARANAKNDQQITVVGRIGGDADPWVKDRAAFSLVDNSLKACSDIEGDACPKPWDYCCETAKLPTARVLVKVVDENGKLVAKDARELLGVKELQTIVVRGKAERDDNGNLTILADGIYVKS